MPARPAFACVSLLVTVAVAVPAPSAAASLVVPAVGRERGVIMFLHAGGWGFGMPAMEYRNAQVFAASRWRGVSVDYPLFDIAAAYASVQRQARDLRVPGRHMISLAWRRVAGAFLRAETRRGVGPAQAPHATR